MAETVKKTRNVPQLSKDVRRLNALKARRAKVAELDAEIEALARKIAEQLGFETGLFGEDAQEADTRYAA